MRHYVSDTTAGNLRRLRYGCTWVNRCISKLPDQNWGFKSWEAFLLCCFLSRSSFLTLIIQVPGSIQQYGRFATTKNTYEAIVTDMGTPELALPIIEDGFIPYVYFQGGQQDPIWFTSYLHMTDITIASGAMTSALCSL
jgi:hypothetical protein